MLENPEIKTVTTTKGGLYSTVVNYTTELLKTPDSKIKLIPEKLELDKETGRVKFTFQLTQEFPDQVIVGGDQNAFIPLGAVINMLIAKNLVIGNKEKSYLNTVDLSMAKETLEIISSSNILMGSKEDCLTFKYSFLKKGKIVITAE